MHRTIRFVIFSDCRLVSRMKTEYQLSKHRFYELKHFCLQYPEWKILYEDADGWSGEGDTTSRDGIRRADLKTRMEAVETAARLCGDWERDILLAVTTGKLPKDPAFWSVYRMFFWALSRIRN